VARAKVRKPRAFEAQALAELADVDRCHSSRELGGGYGAFGRVERDRPPSLDPRDEVRA
jgi:hypothetical protein